MLWDVPPAQKAKELLDQVNSELKLAAEAVQSPQVNRAATLMDRLHTERTPTRTVTLASDPRARPGAPEHMPLSAQLRSERA
jgi:hypothetical protein